MGHSRFLCCRHLSDFDAIQVTLAVVMRAIIDGQIDGKTAGRLFWELQIASKLLLQESTATGATRHTSLGLEESGLQSVGEPVKQRSRSFGLAQTIWKTAYAPPLGLKMAFG